MQTEAAPPGALPRADGANRTRLLGALTTIHALNDFYGLVLPPLIPALRAAFDLSYAQAGVIPFVSTGVSALLQPTLGYIADRRLARRRFLIAGFLGYAVAALWLGSATGYATILLGAALLGLAGSTYHPQSATYLVYYFRERRGFAQGIHGLGNGLGFFIAPIVVGFLVQQIGWQAATRWLVVPGLLGAAIVAATLREPAMQGGRGLFAGVTRPLVLLTLINGMALAVNTGFVTWLPSYYQSRGYGLAEAGLLTGALSAAGLLAQPSGGALSDRLGRRTVILLSLVGLGTFTLTFMVSQTLPAMLAASIAAGFFSSLMPPVAMVYASELAAGQRTGTAVGVVWGLGTAISAFSPLLSGFAIDRLGFAASYGGLGLLAFVAAALALALPRARDVTA